jgi:hypothetical protein
MPETPGVSARFHISRTVKMRWRAGNSCTVVELWNYRVLACPPATVDARLPATVGIATTATGFQIAVTATGFQIATTATGFAAQRNSQESPLRATQSRCSALPGQRTTVDATGTLQRPTAPLHHPTDGGTLRRSFSQTSAAASLFCLIYRLVQAVLKLTLAGNARVVGVSAVSV